MSSTGRHRHCQAQNKGTTTSSRRPLPPLGLQTSNCSIQVSSFAFKVFMRGQYKHGCRVPRSTVSRSFLKPKVWVQTDSLSNIHSNYLGTEPTQRKQSPANNTLQTFQGCTQQLGLRCCNMYSTPDLLAFYAQGWDPTVLTATCCNANARVACQTG